MQQEGKRTLDDAAKNCVIVFQRTIGGGKHDAGTNDSEKIWPRRKIRRVHSRRKPSNRRDRKEQEHDNPGGTIQAPNSGGSIRQHGNTQLAPTYSRAQQRTDLGQNEGEVAAYGATSDTQPSGFRYKSNCRDTCRKVPFLGTVPASPWVGRPCGGCPPHLSGDTTSLLLAVVCLGHGMEPPPCCNCSVGPLLLALPGHEVTRDLEAPNGAFATPGSPDVGMA